MNLSKAFDCISRDLLIAKLHAYGLSVDMVDFLNSRLNPLPPPPPPQKKSVEINNTYSIISRYAPCSTKDIFSNLICQSFYLLYYALNRVKNKSYKKASFNFAYFVDKCFGNSVTEFSFLARLNLNLLNRKQGA